MARRRRRRLGPTPCMTRPSTRFSSDGPRRPKRVSTPRGTGFGHAQGLSTPTRLESFARLIRLFPMGITALYPIIGLVMPSTGPVSAGDWLSLVALGVLFHVYAHVANDVIDLSLDLTDPRRVRLQWSSAGYRPQWGLWIALSTTPVMALLLLGHPIIVAGSLAAGVALLGCYDIASKSLPVPFLADLVQGAGWSALVFVGAWHWRRA